MLNGKHCKYNIMSDKTLYKDLGSHVKVLTDCHRIWDHTFQSTKSTEEAGELASQPHCWTLTVGQPLHHVLETERCTEKGPATAGGPANNQATEIQEGKVF